MILKMGSPKRDLLADTGTRCPICGEDGEIAKKGFMFCEKDGYVLKAKEKVNIRRSK